MDRRDDHEILRKGGFAENEVSRLTRLRKVYHEREMHRALVANRRLEFIRWLVNTGKLTDQIA